MSEVVLASGSLIRKQLLEAAGVRLTAQRSFVDETSIKASLQQEDAPVLEAATVLAEMKAVKVSSAHPSAIVIGCDQILECEGVWFDKPGDLAAAKSTLTTLSGKTHILATSVVIAKNGSRIWQHAEAPKLNMRRLSPVFLEAYLEETGDTILSSVGAYHFEGLGAQLFHKVDGDYFTILGLPLLPVLGFLRDHKVLAS